YVCLVSWWVSSECVCVESHHRLLLHSCPISAVNWISSLPYQPSGMLYHRGPSPSLARVHTHTHITHTHTHTHTTHTHTHTHTHITHTHITHTHTHTHTFSQP